MLSLLALRIKCPQCGKSLLDEKHLLDNEPSVKVVIRFDRKKGLLRLSSVYGSYLIESEHSIPERTLVQFFCPHCKLRLQSTFICDLCQAPMIPLMLEEGGRVYICSRKGCKKHFIEFEDAEMGLSKFYEAYSMNIISPLELRAKAPVPEKQVMKTGTYLYAYCPHCKLTLIEQNTLDFIVLSKRKKEGRLSLSPYLNVFTHRSTIEIPEGEEVRDILCPHCRHSLMEPARKCARCHSRTARVTVSAMSRLISFYICMRKGCTWHGLSEEDTKLIAFEDSMEW